MSSGIRTDIRLPPAPQTEAVLYRGGHVYAPDTPHAQALLVLGGTVAWIGPDAMAASIAAGLPDRSVVDLQGALVAPAFVDAHVHLTATGLSLAGLELTHAPSLAAALDAVAAAARRSPGDAVLWGTGWDETRWPEQRPPTAAELDRAAGGRAVYLARVDVHSAVASSALLAAAGLTPAGGSGRKGSSSGGGESDGAAGRLTSGWVRLAEHDAVRRAARAALGGSQRADAQHRALTQAARHGIACLHECSGPEIAGVDDLTSAVALATGELGPDLVPYWGGPVHEALRLAAQPAGDLFADGTLGSRTAALSFAYLDAPVGAEEHGRLLLDAGAMTRHLLEATRASVQGGFHVIGDRAVLAAVDAAEAAADVVGVPRFVACRHRLEHLEMVPPGVPQRLARLGIVASVQPVFQQRWGAPGQMYDSRVGAERARGMNPLRTLAHAGVPLALGSDAPVTPIDPWAGVRAAVHHPDPEQGLSARAAFAAATRGGWRAARRDGEGVLSVGAPATFAVWRHEGELSVQLPDARVSAWSTDPRSATPGLPDLAAPAPSCERTVVRGVVIYDAVR